MQDSVEVSDVVTEGIHVSLLQFFGLGLAFFFISPLSFPGLSFLLCVKSAD